MASAQKMTHVPPSPCPQGWTPPDSPTRESTSPTIAVDDLKRLLVDVIKEMSATSAGAGNVNAGATECSNQVLPATPTSPLGHSVPPPDMDQLKQLFAKLAQFAATGSPQSDPAGTKEDEDAPSTSSSGACKAEFKKVMEIWDKDISKYKIVESIGPDEVDGMDQYVFVVREHIDEKSKRSTTYIDVKSDVLRDILREVLRDVKAVSVMETKPSIEQNILFHFLAELNDYADKLRGTAGSDPKRFEHLSLLVDHIKDAYAATTQRFGTEKPRCVVFDAGEEATQTGVTFYKLECRYLDYDGQVFGEAGIELGIVKFRGSKSIHTLTHADLLSSFHKSILLRAIFLGFGSWCSSMMHYIKQP
ncbi:hypothetical protein VTN77DRAFT_3492 [Rasamsonia byssochlamydoides]|uniref:uncharacterized protein n=1 Tax=Rasamsonia byssochlamydoides TaxID=89139 RepID=UPI0037441680